MPLNYCISLTDIDPEDAAEIRALVRANGGDEAAGVQQYIDGIMADIATVKGQLAEQGFGVEAQELFQSEAPLYVVHNLSATGVERAAELGGLAAPSIAVARGDLGMENFGEISLIGDPSMLDLKSRRMAAFNADVYSPRQPRAQYDLIDAELRAMRERLEPVAEEIDGRYDSDFDTDRLSREGLEPIERSDITRMVYLRDIGDAPRIVYRKEVPLHADLRKFKGQDRWALERSPEFAAAVKTALEADIAAMPEDLHEKMRDRFLPDGEPSHRRIVDYALKASEFGKRRVDGYEMSRAIRKRIEKTAKRQREYADWVKDNFSGILGKEFFTDNNWKRRAYTLDAVVKEMTRTLRDGEGFNYGAGSVRSVVAKQFRSIKEMQDRRGDIISNDEMDAIKDEANDELIALAGKFAEYHDSGKDFGWPDIFSEFLKDLAHGNLREWQTDIFSSPVPDDLIADARSFLAKLQDLPTEYFEVKFRRAVDFSEFTAALVPKGASKKAVEVLEKAGLRILRYDPKVEGDRTRALQGVGGQTFFQPAWHGSPHIFDAFSTEHIGTGEGAQAFGWGMYFAGRKGVAKFYRDNLSSKAPLQLKDDRALTPAEQSMLRVLSWNFYHSDLQSLSDIDQDWLNAMADLEQEGAENPEGAAFIRSLKPGDFKDTIGRLYKVDIPEDSELLAWDVPLSEQPEGVRDAVLGLLHESAPKDPEGTKALLDELRGDLTEDELLIELGGDPNEPYTDPYLEMTGEQAYHLLADRYRRTVQPGRAEQMASLELRDAGIPGHRFLDGGSRGAGDGTYNYVIYDDQRVDVLEFEQPDGSGARGSITFSTDGEAVIRLFEGRDASTFLHEIGHFGLRMYRDLASDPNAPEELREMMATINEFLGHEEGRYTVEQEEKWARAFEAYVMEGKAPSLSLRSAFSMFAQWLTRIYQTVRGLNVELTPEIREVMDRMLATREELAEARLEAEMAPLFDSAAAAGMSQQDFDAYRRLDERQKEAAESALLEKTMAKIRRARKKWFREEKAAVRAEVEERANDRPEYRLIERMGNQRVIGLEGVTPEDIRLDKAELVERYGEEVLKDLDRSRIGGQRPIWGGEMSVDEAAAYFGFETGDQMIEVLRGAGKRKAFIEAETDRILTERHGDPLDDGSIRDEAMAAIHTDEQAEVVVAEARQLAKRTGRRHDNITARIFKARAKKMLGRMQVREVRPTKFLAAERKAAKAAERAFAKVARAEMSGRRDAEALASAQRFKEQQLLNHFLYMEARDLSGFIDSARERMRRYDKASVREKLAAGYIQQIDALLEDYEFRQASQRELDRRESLAAFMQRMIEAGREGELAIDPRLAEMSRRTHYTRMGVDEFRALMDTIANIDHLGRSEQELIEAHRKREVAASEGRIVNQLRTNVGTDQESSKGLRAKARSVVNLLLSVDSMAIEYDGGDEAGVFYDEIKRSIDEGEATNQRMSVEMMEKMGKVWEAYTGAEIAEMKKARVIEGGNGHAWSKLEIIAAALNMGNLDGRERLLNERVHISRRLTEDQLKALLDTLDKRDWDFVQAQWDLINSYWPELAEVQKRRTGVEPAKVQAEPVETKFGTYEGGYYPLQYDPEKPGAAVVDEQTAWDRYASTGRGALAAVNSGMTKERKANSGGRTLLFDLNVPIKHLRDTIRLIALAEAVDATGKLLNRNGVRDAFLEAGRKNDWEILQLWLKDVARGPIFNKNPVDSVARFFRTNFSMSRLAFNFKTIALQVTGLGQSATLVGKRRLLQAMLGAYRHPSLMAEDVVAKSAFMAERKTTFQKDIYDVTNNLQIDSPTASKYAKARKFLFQAGFEPIVRMQFYGVDVPTWVAAYEQGMERFNNEDRAIQYADRMVARSQGSGLMADRSAFERGTLSDNTRQSDFIRLFTVLASYMITKFNRVRVETLKIGNAGSTGEVVHHASNIALLLMFEGVVMGLAYSMMADDDDEKDNALAMYIASEGAKSLIGGIPFIRDLPSTFAGYDAQNPLSAGVASPVEVYNQFVQGEIDNGLRRSTLNMLGNFTGFPTVFASRIINGLAEDDTPISEILFGKNPLTK